MKKKYIHVYLIQKHIKDILKCLFLHQLYTIKYKYKTVEDKYVELFFTKLVFVFSPEYFTFSNKSTFVAEMTQRKH